MRRMTSILAAFAVFLGVPGAAYAAAVTVNIDGATFEDGSTLNGSFTYDSDFGVGAAAITGLDLVSSAYGPFTTVRVALGDVFNFFGPGAPAEDTPFVQLAFTADVRSGGPLSLGTVAGGFGTFIAFCSADGAGTDCPLKNFIGLTDPGTSVVVPVPAAAPLFAAGLGAFGLWRRRSQGENKKRRAAA